MRFAIADACLNICAAEPLLLCLLHGGAQGEQVGEPQRVNQGSPHTPAVSAIATVHTIHGAINTTGGSPTTAGCLACLRRPCRHQVIPFRLHQRQNIVGGVGVCMTKADR